MIDVALQESLDDNHFPLVSTAGMGDKAIILGNIFSGAASSFKFSGRLDQRIHEARANAEQSSFKART